MHGSKPKFTALATFTAANRLFAELLEDDNVHLHVDPLPQETVPVKWDISGNGHLQSCDPHCLHFHCPKCGDKISRESLSIYCEKDRNLDI